MTNSAAGVCLGMACAVGVLLAVSGLRRTGRPGIGRRIAWYAGGVELDESDRHAWSALLSALLPRWFAHSSRDRRASGLSARLARAGRDASPAGLERFRLTQLGWLAVGMVVGAGVGGLLMSSGASAVGVVLLAGIGAVVGIITADRRLVRQARRRQRRMLQQLPVVAELLAFAVAAGESPVLAIERVAGTVSGDLAGEMRIAIGDIRDGRSINDALRGVAERCDIPEVDRFVDGMVVALERGTPIADVLRAQAADARAGERNRLMELAGRKDVAMLIPVVFLILPTVVLIALYPGFTTLQLIVP